MKRANVHRKVKGGGFNPHPPLLAGETGLVGLAHIAKKVSIHTRHYWRVKRHPALQAGEHGCVSIHTRHYWRVKPWPSVPPQRGEGVSIHTRHYWRVKQGRVALGIGQHGFNPHPPLLAGETSRGPF